MTKMNTPEKIAARAGLPLTDCRFMLRSDNYRNRSVNQCYEI
jgi:hypothetical protein